MENIRAILATRLRKEAPANIQVPGRTAAAVLVPFFERNGEPHLLFTKRSENVQHHRSEISFPGGARDTADRDLEQTALRELYEEVAVPPQQVEVLGCLDRIKTYVSSFIVVPFIGILNSGVPFDPNREEVAELLEVPLKDLMDPSIFREESFHLEDRLVPVYYYRWRSHTIWGMTGRILKTLLDLMREGVPT